MAEPPAPAPAPGLNPIGRWLGSLKSAFVIASDLYQLTKWVEQLEADHRKLKEEAATSFRQMGEHFRKLGERVAKLERQVIESVRTHGLRHLDTASLYSRTKRAYELSLAWRI
jgi:hypothetical protein